MKEEMCVYERELNYQIECCELSQDKSNLILIVNHLIKLCVDNNLLDERINDIYYLSDICEELGIEPCTRVIGYGLSDSEIDDYYERQSILIEESKR